MVFIKKIPTCHPQLRAFHVFSEDYALAPIGLLAEVNRGEASSDWLVSNTGETARRHPLNGLTDEQAIEAVKKHSDEFFTGGDQNVAIRIATAFGRVVYLSSDETSEDLLHAYERDYLQPAQGKSLIHNPEFQRKLRHLLMVSGDWPVMVGTILSGDDSYSEYVRLDPPEKLYS